MMKSLKIRIDGLNLSRIIGRLIADEVFVNDLVVKAKYITFSINESDLSTFIKVCNIERKKYRILSQKLRTKIFRQLKRMLGFCLACTIISCYIFSMNCFLFNIEIDASTDELTHQIENILKDNGVCAGILKSEVSAGRIEQIILKDINDVKGCDIRFKGNSLKIKVYESAKQDSNIQRKIQSKYDAVVTKINIASGNSKFKIGDIVRVGDILIESDVSAVGEIFGKVCFVETMIFNENQIKQVETGEIVEIKNFIFRNKIINKSQNINRFSNYIVEKCDFYILENLFLPLRCEIVKFIEVENIDVVVPFQEQEKSIKDELYKKVMENIPAEENVINVSYSVTNEGTLYRIDCYVECEINLAK